jgi:hypothetical protein
MQVEYEVFYGAPTNLKPMLLADAQRLESGDEVFVWFAKDNDLRDVRINQVCTVKSVTPLVGLGWQNLGWQNKGVTLDLGVDQVRVLDEDVSLMPDENSVDTGRGWLRLYYPPEED